MTAVEKVLPPNATFVDVGGTLPDARHFVANVFQNMRTAEKAGGDVVVRMGVTGHGVEPSYRLESATSGEVLVAFDGKTHAVWPGGERFDTSQNWSSETMTLTEVKALVKRLAGWSSNRR